MRRLSAPYFYSRPALRSGSLAGALAVLTVVAASAAGCKDRLVAQPVDADLFDGGGRADGPVQPLEIDFAATGCPEYDLAASRCSGVAPLTVAFAPIGSGSITRFLWDFGDGTPKSADRAPAHTYVIPGVFTVSLVGAGATGTVSKTHRQFVVANVAGVGGLCDVDAQCATGLHCLCGAGSACGGAFPRGVCTAECRAGVCSGGAVCADLPVIPPQAPPTTDRIALCLAPCEDDTACAQGLTCRALLSATTSAQPQPTWTRGCFAATTLEVGSACRTASGVLSDGACVTGRCDDLGALGLCVSSCAGGQLCPPGTACASFRDGRTVCLRSCAQSTDCGRDPLIGCEPAGAPGAMGFTLAAAPGPASTACAPKGCVADDDCGPAGTCQDGHCTRR